MSTIKLSLLFLSCSILSCSVRFTGRVSVLNCLVSPKFAMCGFNMIRISFNQHLPQNFNVLIFLISMAYLADVTYRIVIPEKTNCIFLFDAICKCDNYRIPYFRSRYTPALRIMVCWTPALRIIAFLSEANNMSILESVSSLNSLN